MGILKRLFQANPPSKQSSQKNPPPAIKKPTRRPSQSAPQKKRRAKPVDVPGTRDRAVAGTDHFQATVDALPLGKLKVSLRMKPNKDNPHAVAAFVGAKQVGWLSTAWEASDPHVRWMKRLEEAGIRPRFEGQCKLTEVTKARSIVFNMPEDRELSAIADGVIART
ncbi:hypothetical protein [Gordonia alkanivorans]|uniref:hypothetical protein n=1 Tax=Gordonia alkanivorans TaxID=84096 RepID=UPI000FDE8103|nr:hypothetical protein [Gordonia alkanivorans]